MLKSCCEAGFFFVLDENNPVLILCPTHWLAQEYPGGSATMLDPFSILGQWDAHVWANGMTRPEMYEQYGDAYFTYSLDEPCEARA